MNSAKARIKQFIDNKGISYRKFYEETGLSNSFLSNDSAISSDNLLKIFSTYPDLELYWVVTGYEAVVLTQDKYNSIGRIIKSLRIRHGYKSSELAILLQIERDELLMYETGVKIVSNQVLAKLCSAFDLSVNQFLKADIDYRPHIDPDGDVYHGFPDSQSSLTQNNEQISKVTTNDTEKYITLLEKYNQLLEAHNELIKLHGSTGNTDHPIKRTGTDGD